VPAESSGQQPLATPPSTTKPDDAQAPVAAAAAQRAPIAEASGIAAPSATPTDVTETVRLSMGAQRAPIETASRPGANAKGSPGKRSEQELEELAGQLYARIGNRLRRELLVDRERAGLVMDRT